ncbi:MAG: CHASE2 domain-containing protein, partial [Spirochaetales bacterium]|nr:CHASE2 domain-containing protein [Spirochaetales bacterium]
MSKSKHPKSLYIAPLAISALFGILYLFQFWQNLEYGAYDLFLGMKPPVAIDESIVLLDIDDPSIEKIGSYPWPRGLLAQGLEALAELDAEYAIFDIEYLENSPKTVDSTYMEGPLASEFETSYGEIESNLSDVFQALAERRIPLSEAGSYGQALLEYMDSVWSNLIKKTSLVAIENDSYLGQAMRLFGSAYTTLNMQPDPASAVYAERMTLAKERFVYANAEKESEGIVIPSDTVSYLVPIPEISGASAGAGFTNVWIDADGVRRRIRLVDEVDGDLYLQLAMAPLAHKIGNPRITVGNRFISLEGATIVDEKSSIRIPLDDQGMMLIRWPREAYIDSFKHIPFHLLLDYRNDAEELASDLRRLKANQGWILGPGYAP